MKRAQRRARKALWITAVLASRMYLGLALGLVAWAVLPMLLQWQATVVVSGSMRPGINVGDILIAQPLKPGSNDSPEVKIGTVTLAHDPAKPGSVVTHRVVSIRPNGTIITRGDANKTNDSTPVPKANVIGVERILVPYIGIPVQYMRAGDPVPAILFVVVTGGALMIVFSERRRNAGKTEQQPYTKIREIGQRASLRRKRRRRKNLSTFLMLLVIVGSLVMITGSESTARFMSLSSNASHFAASSAFP